MTKIFESLSTSSTPERNASLGVDHETPPVNSDLSAFLTEIEVPLSRFAPIYANTSEQAGVNLEASTPFVGTSDRTGGGSGEQYPYEQIGQKHVAQEQIVQEILVAQFDIYRISPTLSDEKSLDSMRRVCRMTEELEFLPPVPHPPAPPLADLPFREDLNRIRAGNHRWDDLSYSRICLARDRLDTWNSEYWAVEMRRPQLSKMVPRRILLRPMRPICKGPMMHQLGGSVPDELNEPNGPVDAFRIKGKGKVDPVDKKAEKKRIAAKAKAELEAGRILTFQIGGTCEVLPSEAPVAQSLVVIPPASLPVNFDSVAIPPCSTVQTAVNVSQTPPPRTPSLTPLSRLASELSSESSLSKRRRTTEVSRQRASGSLGNSSVRVGAELIRKIGGIGVKFPANLENLLVPDRFLDWSRDLLNIINSGSRIIGAYEAVAKKEEQIKSLLVFTDVDATRKKLDRQKARADSWERIVKKERDKARRRADEIASGSSARGARHSSRLKRICLYLIALHAQEEVKTKLCYRRGARMSSEKMVEAEYELPPGLLENYVKEEEEYLAKVESFDPLGDDTLFPTPPSPPAGLPRDAAS
ncbi:hypothetical protein AALP_AA6G302800 [Arabis alpina]|uniref:Uncharacterized protein n=1 Tax=Arabis alpina TaxID=50452 RepID=A0A087GSP8_ARAAL|nr:hypothetical protein AALP_AA6G302800 [Arabis alpina]